MSRRPLAHIHRFLALLACALFAAAAWAAPGTYLGKTLTCLPGGQSAAHRMIIQPDGKMISIGYAYFGTKQYSMTRYNTDGTVDAAYGQNHNGTQLEPLGPGNGEAWGAALTADGKLVVGGFVRSDKDRFGVARFNADGTLDLNFGGGGAATSVGPGDSGGYGLAIQSDGKVVQGGYSIGPTGKKVFTVVRYNLDTTSLDTSFGTGGAVVFPEGTGDETIHSLSILSDGRIVVAGGDTNGTYLRTARLTSTGALDPTWGGSGTLTYSGMTGGWDMSFQSDGKMVVVGTMHDTGAGQIAIAIGRMNTDGTLDTTFGHSGYAEGLFGEDAFGYGIVALGDGHIVVSGNYVHPAAGTEFIIARYTSAGALDTSFGTGGSSSSPPPETGTGYGLALRSNGNFVVAGSTANYEEVRAFTSSGAVDTSFNNGQGSNVVATGCQQAAGFASARQSDGKIVVAGTVFNIDTTDPIGTVVERFNTDGTQDMTFGSSGSGFTMLQGLNRTNAVAVGSDGKITTGGYALVNGTTHAMAFARLNPDGSPVTGFGQGGVATLTPSTTQEEINGVAVLADGSVIGAGLKGGGQFLDSIVVKLTPAGALDSTFGSGGTHTVSMSTGSDQFNAVGIQGNGKIVATGWLEVSGSQDSMGVVRFNADGSLDSGFGAAGIATITFGSQTSHANAMVIQPDGKIVAVGQVFGSSTWDFALARLNTNGGLDTGFGTNGIVQSDFTNHNEAFAVALLASGKIVVAGTNGDLFGIAQYLANGTLDTSFGTGGVVTQQVNAGSPDIAYGLSIGSDGTIYAAGNMSKLVGLARFAGDTGTTLATATVNLASSGNPSNAGQAVTFTAVVTGSSGTPTGTVTFNDGTSAIAGCSALTVTNGSAACGTSALSSGSHSITAVYSGSATYNGATSNTVTQTVQAASTETNVALASNGGVASASSQYASGFPIAAINNGERAGANWTNGGGWADGTVNAFPDWVQIDFNGPKLVDKVVVYTVQDNYQAPSEPTDTLTFTQYGIVDFTVQGWDGAQWQTLAAVTGNNLVKRTVTFTAFNTTKIRVNVTNAMNSLSRITEVEAFGTTGTIQPPPSTTNVALASNGATASASSQFGAGFPVAAVINGDATGAGWTNGGGWADGTQGQYPDWVEVDFAQASQIDHVVVTTLQDNWQNPSQPTDTMTFTQYGVTAFDVQAWNGSAWQSVGSVTGNNLVKRTVSFNAVTTSKIRIVVNAALNSLSRIVEVEAWTGSGTGGGGTGTPSNVALASAGSSASASSQYGAGFPVAAIINGDATGANWANGGGWADGTIGQYPDWVQVNFPAQQAITKVVVYTLQDNYQNPVQPTDTMTFTQYGITAFDVQGWDGSQWVTLASITGNNLVKRTVTFNAFTTSQIRINVKNALNSLSRITEVEAWGVPAGGGSTGPTGTNVAQATNGGTVSASSQYSGGFPVAAVIDGDRKGLNWSNGGGWADGTLNAYPDWVEVDFSGSKTLNTVIVYTLQDNWQNPSEPTDAMTFSQYGIRDFTVQAWDGTAWQTVGTASGNNMVKRSFPVSVTTTKIRVNVTNALNSLSRITEIEAFAN